MMTPEMPSFTRNVEATFSFLGRDRGFATNSDVENNAVTFTSDRLTITVFRDPASYMIYVELRRNGTGEKYLLHEIVRALAPDEASRCQCSGADEQKTRRCLNQLAQLCERHLQKFLDMDERTLEKVASTAKTMREQYTLEAQYGAIKDRANQAWDAKDWQTARELYEEAKPSLSDAEERRLDFLLKKSAGGPPR